MADATSTHTDQTEQTHDQMAVRILYTNYRGETGVRRILPQKLWFGSTAWHPEKQWMLDAVDLEKDARRSFALRDIRQYDA